MEPDKNLSLLYVFCSVLALTMHTTQPLLLFTDDRGTNQKKDFRLCIVYDYKTEDPSKINIKSHLCFFDVWQAS